MKSRHYPRVICSLRVEELETRLTPAPVILQPDLQITNIGAASDGPPAQMVFGPDGRLYMTLANFSGPNAASVESFAYSPTGGLCDERTEVSTGGALGIGFGPVSLGVYGQPGVQTVTGMYLTDTARTIDGNDVSNLRVLTQDQNGVWGGPNGGTDTIIVQNIPAGWHQADQIIIKENADGTSTLYVGIGVRTEDGALSYPNPGDARDMAYGGTISEILDLKQVNGLVTDSAGFGLTGVATSNSDPDYSNAGPYTSTAVNKLIVQSSGARNPFGLALDGSGNLWFTNNFNRSQSDGTFNGTIDPSTGLLYGITTGDPAPGPDLANNAYDQFFEAAPLADYGYNNSNWRNDAADDNPSVTSEAAIEAGFFNFAEHGVRSTTFDNLVAPPGGFAEYNESDIDHIQGLGPSASADGVAFYTGTTFPATYQGDAFIARYNSTVTDSTGHSITYDDLVTVDPTTGNVRIIADDFDNPLAVLYDGSGNMLIADYGDSAIYRLSAAPPPVATQPPPGVVAGSTFGLTVDKINAQNQLDTSYNGTVTLSLANNPGNSTLGGTLTVQAVNGVATFSGLTISNPGLDYTFDVSATGAFPITTSSIDVAGYQLVVNGPNENLVWFGTTGSDQVQFTQTDTDTVQITVSELAGTLTSFTTTITGVTGSVVANEYDVAGDADVVDGSGLTTIPSVITVGNGNDTVIGGGGANTIVAGNGNNTIYGNGIGNSQIGKAEDPGNTITVGNGNNLIYGNYSGSGYQGGNNTITAGGGNNTIYGNYGNGDGAEGSNNTITVGNGNNVIYGNDGNCDGDGAEGGNNTIVAGNGDDTIYGNMGGNDPKHKGGSNFIDVGNGSDTIYGNFGGDGGEGGNNTILTGSGQDTIYGYFGGDGGEGGNDLIVAGGGNDTIYAHCAIPVGSSTSGTTAEGRDLIIGGTGADTVYGWPAGYTLGSNTGDLFIGGTTNLSLTSLDAVLAEWSSSDSYATRVADLSGANGPVAANGGNYLISGTTVFGSAAVDQVFGTVGSDDDWYLVTSDDVLNNVNPNEVALIAPLVQIQQKAPNSVAGG